MSNFSFMQPRDVLRQPYFQVILGGKLIPPSQHKKITEVMIEDFDDKLNLARLLIDDSGDFYFVNNPSLVRDTYVVIGFGHIGNHRTMISGKISLVEVNFQKTGIVRLTVSVIDEGVIMSKDKKTRKWENTTVSNVVKAIVIENGFFCEVLDTITVLPQITQNDETDLSFIYRLASEYGYSFYCVSEGVYYFGYVDENSPPYATLNYMQKDCSIISCTLNYESKGEKEIKSSDIDASTGETASSAGSLTTNSDNSNVPVTEVDKATGNETYLGKGLNYVQERED